PHQFAVELSNHIVGLCANGIFDRFPTVKVIVGHLGERIPSDFWCLDESEKKPQGMPMKRKLSDYWKINIYETTTGNFWTPLLDFNRNLLGADRILYSINYLFVMMQQGQEWLDTLPYSNFSKLQLICGNAI
ncbi:hypothetical protein B0O99DRAFT_508227, partial [Bisporella sp. PMI_857]